MKARDLKKGDVLGAIWGYSATYIDYYLVTKLSGKKSVELIKIGDKIERSKINGTNSVPDLSKKIGDKFTRRIMTHNNRAVKIDDHSFASKLKYELVGGEKVYKPTPVTCYY